MGSDSPRPAAVTGYEARPVTKAPNWHGLVAFDVLFNNMSAGLFLVAALGELVAPATFAAAARVAYPLALLLLVADLVCLVVELGDPRRFHHMLRVFKLSSPMSFGTWCLTAYGMLLSVPAAMSLLPRGGVALEWVRRIALIAGLLPAAGAAVYKGVLFSTTAQPGWKDARWLGGYLTNSALMLGCAELLFLAILMAQPGAVAVLRPTLLLLLVLNAASLGLLLADVRATLRRVYTREELVPLVALGVGGGLLVPLGLLVVGGPLSMTGAVLLILLAALVVRWEVVRWPHALGQADPVSSSPPPP